MATKGIPFSEEHKKNLTKPRETRFCECKCGERFMCKIDSKQRFISGHQNRNRLKGRTLEEIMGKEKAEEKKRNQRIWAVKRIEEHNGKAGPNYNPKACEFFKGFDKQNNTEGQYATNRGEHIQELGYFLDYFNPNLKLIMEYDEKAHFDSKGNLKERDMKRQEQIKKFYSDFEFRRIKEDKKLCVQL